MFDSSSHHIHRRRTHPPPHHSGRTKLDKFRSVSPSDKSLLCYNIFIIVSWTAVGLLTYSLASSASYNLGFPYQLQFGLHYKQ